MIWKYQKYVGDTKFHELFDSKKFLARAHSEYSTTYAKKPWFLSFHSDMRFSARHARKCARAKNFFWKCNLHDKISLKIFCLVIIQKANFLEQFEVWNFFLKIRFFPKILKIWKISIFFWIFHEKIQYSKASTVINSKDIRILKIPRIYRIDQRISCWKNFLARAHFLARAGRIFYHRRKKSMILNFGARALLW